MEHHPSALSIFLTWLLHLPKTVDPHFAHGEPLSLLERYDHLFAAVLAALVTLLIVWLVRRRMAVIPGPFQQVMEYAITFLRELLSDNIAHHSERYLPLVGTIGLFVLLNNLFGLVPGMPSGTANWNVTLGCALVVFGYYNFHGMKEQGFLNYWKHFAGPVLFLAPLMFPLEILGLFSRILSHSLRLFGNIAGEHVVSLIFFSLMPFLLPVPMMAMGLFFGLIQAFVFVMLSVIYISGAVAHEH